MDGCASAARDHVHQHGAVVVVFGIGTVNYLAQAKSVLVVGIRVGMRTVCDRSQLLAFPGERLAQIALGVAHGVVSDGLIVERGKTIAPLAVIVAISNGLHNSAESIGCISVLLLAQDIAPSIVFIGISGVVCVAGTVAKVLSDKLIGGVIFIRILLRRGIEGAASAPDLGNITVGVIGIAVIIADKCVSSKELMVMFCSSH